MTDSSNVPFHEEQIITNEYGRINPIYHCGWHTGVDIVPTNNNSNREIYSVCDGEVVNVLYGGDLGQQCVVYDGTYYWRYCHMVYNSVQVNVGDTVDRNSLIGIMGGTGQVSGDHLHLECSTVANWDTTCEHFENPCDVLGFPNTQYEILNWIPFIIKTFKTKFKWVLYARKLRERRK